MYPIKKTCRNQEPLNKDLIIALETWSINTKTSFTLEKEGSLLRDCLEMWDEAGDNPYEVLKEEGVYDFFMNVLNAQSVTLCDHIYRGTLRHGELKVGDTIEYTLPKSWTFNIKTASEFIEVDPVVYPNAVILRFMSPYPFIGIHNPYNKNREEEFITGPINLLITGRFKTKKGNFRILDVTPVVTVLPIRTWIDD